MRDIAVICGPTAAGKSEIAMSLAQRAGAIIISADSRQVYRGFDIGTAKPDAADRFTVLHRGVDVVEPGERYSAAQWAADATRWLHEASAAGQAAVVVGGTGFYLRALDTPLFDSPPLDPGARQQLLAELDRLTTAELRTQCRQVDPARSELGRTQLLRALETHALTGRPLSEWLTERARSREFRAHFLVLDPGDALRERIATRVRHMLDCGWEREVEHLAARVPDDAPAWNACGYAMLRAALRGDVSRADAIERTIIDTRQYAKRQRTWFRHQLPPDRTTRLDPSAPDAIDQASTWLDTVSLAERA